MKSCGLPPPLGEWMVASSGIVLGEGGQGMDGWMALGWTHPAPFATYLCLAAPRSDGVNVGVRGRGRN